MKTITRSSLAMIAILFGLLIPATLVMPVHAAVTENIMIPFDQTETIPGVEDVALSGYFHIVNTVTEDGNGGMHFVMRSNAAGVSGIGLTSGDVYQMAGAAIMQGNMKPPYPAEMSWVSNAWIIGPGTGNNYLVYITVHMVVNANGEMVVTITDTGSVIK